MFKINNMTIKELTYEQHHALLDIAHELEQSGVGGKIHEVRIVPVDTNHKEVYCVTVVFDIRHVNPTLVKGVRI